MITERSIKGIDDAAFEAACKAFSIGPPGVLRRVQQHDSYPGERVAPDDPPDPDAYAPIKTTLRDERTALAEAINAYLASPKIDVPHVPCRGSDVETYIKAARDRVREAMTRFDDRNSAHDFALGILRSKHQALDDLLDDYRLHSDTGTPLDQVALDGGDPENSGAHL